MARVRLLAGVGTHVLAEVACLAERLVARIAGERPVLVAAFAAAVVVVVIVVVRRGLLLLIGLAIDDLLGVGG